MRRRSLCLTVLAVLLMVCAALAQPMPVEKALKSLVIGSDFISK